MSLLLETECREMLFIGSVYSYGRAWYSLLPVILACLRWLALLEVMEEEGARLGCSGVFIRLRTLW